VGRIHGNASLITFIDTLSAPEALFEGNEITILRIANVEIARNENTCPKNMSKFVRGPLQKFHIKVHIWNWNFIYEMKIFIYEMKIFIYELTNIKHFPCWYTVISTRVEIGKTRNCVETRRVFSHNFEFSQFPRVLI
jgi:hypothetical protein